MAQNFPGGLIRPTPQSGLKKLGGQKNSGIHYFQASVCLHATNLLIKLYLKVHS